MRQFLLAQLASATSIMGGSMMFLTLPWLTLSLTNSATLTGLAIAIQSIPGLVLSPIMGSFVDRLGRRRVAIWAEGITVVTTIAYPIFDGSFGMTLPALITIGVVRAFFGGGGMTARKSLLPDVARVANLSLDKANSIHESLAAAAFATGPAIASLVIALTNPMNAFWVCAGFLALSALFAALIKVDEFIEPDAEREGQHFLVYAMQGFKILKTLPAVAIIFVMVIFLALLYMPTEFVVLPRYYSLIGDPTTLGLLLSVMAFSTSAGSLLFSQFTKRLSYGNILRVTVLGVGLALIPMSFLPPTWVMLACGVVLGFVWGPLPPLLNTVIQQQVPASMRGRVFSVEMTIWNAAPMISMVFTGMAVDAFGVQLVYWAIAALVMVAAVLVSLAPALKDLSAAKSESV
ncbi:MAG: MFS transporter [Microbacteriaceae bacterium]